MKMEEECGNGDGMLVDGWNVELWHMNLWEYGIVGYEAGKATSVLFILAR
ncbi:hypothetical protein J2S74_003317 [Evansella vedderi]|uniref:Uncharacterized protein n=1 Tax=Evansella vedderi TaxID=38282 RepID=A0ABT9ZXG6_9BACI|nr:hypothetical protein [Evansella vedderi]MDQ0255933.1 hypothetical protein [Evansella vedderi]